jgi:myosin heavy subunit
VPLTQLNAPQQKQQQQQQKHDSANTLPPLKNPPMLDGVDDLTQLSYLHEPGGMCLSIPKFY